MLVIASTFVVMSLPAAGTIWCAPALAEEPAPPSPATTLVALPEPRTVEYHWYDMFNVSFEDYWEWRWDFYGDDEPISDSYPYIFRRHYDDGNYTVHSSMRLDISGRNMSCFNMNDNPQFLPLFGEERGGQATIDWDMQYFTRDEWLASMNAMMSPYYDGQVIRLTGTTSLDRQAAKAVMNLTDEQFDDFASWWSVHQSDFEDDYIGWLEYEGRERLDIWPMYGYDLAPLWCKIEGERTSEGVVLTYDILSWGMEALLTRWLHEAFMPTEWYFENISLSTVIGPNQSDLDMDTVVVGALTASATKLDLEPCWVWQGMLQDYITASMAHPYSDFDDYAWEDHVRYSPGSADYGLMTPYRSTPGAFDLAEGETLVFDIPREEQLFERHLEPGVIENFSGPMVCAYAEPMWSDPPVDMGLDTDGEVTRMTFTGPFDFRAWSEEQTAHQNLSDEWDRLSILPYGMPYIEFSDGSDNTPPAARFTASLEEGYTGQEIEFDASASSDEEDETRLLRIRWDWESDGTFDTNWTVEKTASHSFATPGEHTVTLQVVDSRMGYDQTERQVEMEQHFPSETTATVSGTFGDNSWYVSNVSIDFTTVDGSVPVDCTFYRIEGGSWYTYDGELEIWVDGRTNLEFYSMDTIGLSEDVNTLYVAIDKIGPTVSSTTPEAFNSSSVTVTWTCHDTVSGINRVYASLDGAPRTMCLQPDSITLEGLSDGEHLLTVQVFDSAGNIGTTQIEFVVNEDRAMTLALPVMIGAASVCALVVILLYFTRFRKPDT
jgi:PKD repeat protein